MVHESDGDTNCNSYVRNRHQRINTGTGEVGNKRKSGDHPNYNIVEIGQNIKKSLGDLRILAVIQTPVENPSANAGVKNSQKSKIMIVIIYKCKYYAVYFIIYATSSCILIRMNLQALYLNSFSFFFFFFFFQHTDEYILIHTYTSQCIS